AGCRVEFPRDGGRVVPETVEVVVVGGGVGGGALATALARAGVSTLVLEKSIRHVDRVRGEWLSPWGVAETMRLGLYESLIGAGAHHISEHIGFGDDVDEATARDQALKFPAFAGA